MDSIQEQIIKQLASALAAITTIKVVQRDTWDGINLAQLPTVLIREGDCSVELLDSTHNGRIRRKMEVLLSTAVQDDGVHPAAELLNSVIAEIENCLAASQQWGGLALMTSPPEYLYQEIDADTPHLARGLRIEITYEHQRTNPWAL